MSVTKYFTCEKKFFSITDYKTISHRLIEFFKQSDYTLTMKREGLEISLFYLTYDYYLRIKIEPLYLKSGIKEIYRIRVSYSNEYAFITPTKCTNERIFEVADKILNEFDSSTARSIQNGMNPDNSSKKVVLP